MMKARKSNNVSAAIKGLAHGFSEAGRNMTPSPSKRIKNAESKLNGLIKGFDEAGRFMANGRH